MAGKNAGNVAKALKEPRRRKGGNKRVIPVNRSPDGVQIYGHYRENNFPNTQAWRDEVALRPELQVRVSSVAELKKFNGKCAAGVQQFGRAFHRALPRLVRQELGVRNPTGKSPKSPEYLEMRAKIVKYVFNPGLWPNPASVQI